VAAPLLLLFGLTVVQGKTLFGGTASAPVFVFASEKFVVWGVFLCSFLFFCLVFGSSVTGVCPGNWLGSCTSGLASVACPSRILLQTEVASLQGGGLALLPCLGRPRWLCGLTFCKAIVCLCVVCFLV